MTRIAIFASGSGTNAEAIARRLQGSESATVEVVVTNRRHAGVHERMHRLNVPTINYPAEEWRSGARNVADMLRSRGVGLIVLAGFLARVPAGMVREWEGRIVNIHPSLLPRHGGPGMYGERVHQAVLDAGDSESGITIHLVDELYDHGRTLLQVRCPVMPDDTPDTLAARIHGLEHANLPLLVERLAAELG